MKTIVVDGVECVCVLEQADDGGMVINTLVPAGNGEFLNHRHWIGAGVEASEAAKSAGREQARAVFAGLDESSVRPRAEKARRRGVSGKLHRE